MLNQIRDWKIQIAQAFLPLLIIPFVLILDIPQKIEDALTKSNVDINELDVIWRIAIGLGKWPLIGVVLFFIYRAIRNHNREEVLKQNLNIIVWHSYVGYWFCRWILNYQTISLTRVPIPIQFKLVWESLFKNYEYMENVTEKTELDIINFEVFQAEPFTSTVNFILADTYPLEDWKAKIPASFISYSTIIINRSEERGVRYFSKDYVAKMAVVVHELPITVTDINIFATINAAHVYHIVNEVFKTGARDGIRRIKVYQQTSGNWVFEGKKHVEIKIGA